MPDEIILLTGDVEAPYLLNIIKDNNPDVKVTTAHDQETLKAACTEPRPDDKYVCRLIAYCTNIIVPKQCLESVASPAYNFHPGPPEYPGSSASGFAIYNGARKFGVCAHEMEEAVDAGQIVGIDEFEIADDIRFMDLDLMAYRQLFQLFVRLAPHLALDDTPLPSIEAKWGGRKTTQADVEAMKEISADTSEEEIRRRWRAFG
jgi:methionyl-tRNA formyltransferase